MLKNFRRLAIVVFLGLPTLAMPVAAAAPLITAGMIANGAVTRDKIAYGAVDGARIANGTITLDKLAVLNVLEADIGSRAVTSSKLADGAVRRRKIANRAVDKRKIAFKSIDSRRIIDRSVRRVDLANNSVNSHKITNNSVKGIDVKDGYLTGADLGTNSVGGEKIRDGSLTGADIAGGSLDQSKFPLALVGPQTGLRFETGETTISTAALGIQTRTVGFDQNFTSPPLVLVSFKNVSDFVSTANLYGSGTNSEIGIGMKVSASSGGTYATISWVAIGK